MAVRRVVFDIETSNVFEDVGSNAPEKLDISIVGVYDSSRDVYESFSVGEFSALWPILERADVLIGFNNDHFDLPLLNKYYPGDLSRLHSVDLLAEVKQVLGRRLKLDTLAEATLGEAKSGHGLEAVRWWKEGKEDLVRKYCLDDVRLTKELYDYARKHKKLLYKDFGELKEVRLDTSKWEKGVEREALTHTLPL